MLSDFAASADGSFGNAFMLFYPTWWDYTIIGIEAGAMDWPNGIVDIEVNVPNQMNDLAYCVDAPYPLDPEKDLLFFYHYDDPETEDQLLTWFPNGVIDRVVTSNSPNHDFKTMRVPALGTVDFDAFVQTYATDRACFPAS